MDKIVIDGGQPLAGSVKVGGSKNAALPMLAATLLTADPCEIKNVPNLRDIDSTFHLLSHLGVKVEFDAIKNEFRTDARDILELEAPYDLVRKMRASVLVLGPLLARFGEVKVSLPGGCAIGARPIDFHLDGMRKLGAEIELESGYILAKAKKLHGAHIVLDFPSVGATENLMMAACLIPEKTVIENAAKEPEIVALGEMLVAMGASLVGVGTEKVTIEGRKTLSGATVSVMGDRIEAGTFMAAAFMTRGSVVVSGVDSGSMDAVLEKLLDSGAKIEILDSSSIRVTGSHRPKSVNLTTQPFPGFPTDMQAQFMAIMAIGDGTSTITESIFENRFMHVPELIRMGADIQISGKTAIIKGVTSLKGAPVMATDLRASAGLILGGLVAEGETVVSRVYHLDRGYEQIESKLANLGAKIRRVNS